MAADIGIAVERVRQASGPCAPENLPNFTITEFLTTVKSMSEILRDSRLRTKQEGKWETLNGDFHCVGNYS